MTEDSPQEYVVVYLANGMLAGEMIRNFLQAQGIPAMLNQESAGTTYGFTVGPLGLVDVLVPANQKDEAKKLLEEMEEGDFELPDEEDEEDIE